MALHIQLDELINRVLPVAQHFHGKGMLAPHAATIDKTGELSGRALTTDGTEELSVSQAIEHFESTFAQLAAEGNIQASGISIIHRESIYPLALSLCRRPTTLTNAEHWLHCSNTLLANPCIYSFPIQVKRLQSNTLWAN
jgi:hypothetical protein